MRHLNVSAPLTPSSTMSCPLVLTDCLGSQHPGYFAPGSGDEFETLMESIADPGILQLVEGLFEG